MAQRSATVRSAEAMQIALAMRAAEDRVREAVRGVPEAEAMLRRPRTRAQWTASHDVDGLHLAVDALVKVAREQQAARPAARAALRAVEEAQRLRWALARTMDDYCRRISRRAREPEDVYQEARLGAHDAAKRYDPARGVTFIVYARWWIRHRLSRDARRSRPVALSARDYERETRMARVEAEHGARAGAAPDDEALAAATGIAVEVVRSLRASARPPLSIEDRTGDQRIVDTLRADESDLGGDLDEHDAASRVRWLLLTLREREREVIERSYGLHAPAESLQAVAREWGLTRERARQVRDVALRRLREALTGDGARLTREAMVCAGQVPPEGQRAWVALVLAGGEGLTVEALAERLGLGVDEVGGQLAQLRALGWVRGRGLRTERRVVAVWGRS